MGLFFLECQCVGASWIGLRRTGAEMQPGAGALRTRRSILHGNNRAMHDLLNLSFWGLASKAPGSTAHVRPHFASLQHFIEFAKFGDGHNHEVREAVLLMPSVKEVLKFSQAHRGKWRTDWALIRSRIILQGLALLQHEHASHPMWIDPAASLKVGLLAIGLTEVVAESIIGAHVAQMSGAFVVVLGAGPVPAEEVSKRINNLHKRTAGKWKLLHWQGRHVSWSVHDWMVGHRMPVKYAGSAGERLSPTALAALMSAADQFLIFEERGGRGMDNIIAKVKRGGKPCEVALWSAKAGTLDLF